MIVRILNEGQWRLSDDAVRGLNSFDDAVEQAVTAGDQDQLTSALHSAAGPDSDSAELGCRTRNSKTPI